MNRTQQIADIRSKCIVANPEILTRYLTGDGDGGAMGAEDDIRLADVLLAIGTAKNIVNNMGGIDWSTKTSRDVVSYWNLRADDLTKQSDLCVAFLSDLLT